MATTVSELMTQMAQLLPFSRSPGARHVLELPSAASQDLTRAGFFVYALVSPFWGKLYIGAVGLEGAREPVERLREHIAEAKKWQSRTSVQRYGGRSPALYRAMAKVGPENVIMVLIAETAAAALRTVEKIFIRKAGPVFNVMGVRTDETIPRALRKLLGASLSEDMRLNAALLLRMNHPRLPAHVWLYVIKAVEALGDRDTALKVARQARQLCPQLGKLRAFPRLVFPCPVSAVVLSQLKTQMTNLLHALPLVCRTLQFYLMVESTSVCWERTAYAEAVLAPANLPMQHIGSCQCHSLPSALPRRDGHVITREWQALPCCRELAAIVGTASLQCRTYPSLDAILEEYGERVQKYLKMAGFPKDDAAAAWAAVSVSSLPVIKTWYDALPAMMRQSALVTARHRLWGCGLVMARIDRSPGRVLVMCVDAWRALQNATFLHNPRYRPALHTVPCDDDPLYAARVRESFSAAVPDSSKWIGRPPGGGAARPQSYFTVKQKSLITSAATAPVVKVRPLITYSRHPLKAAMARIARCLSLLVIDARRLVIASRPHHLPMWQLHSGSAEWLQRLASTKGWWGLDEYDVADCFLNTPREQVLKALNFWLARTAGRTRGLPWFAISKDSKKGDYRGKPCNSHYWAISAEQLVAACTWDLVHNSEFEAQDDNGNVVVLEQRRGLPIGGHLSAAYVELVALRRELQCAWPAMLQSLPTARYRDNLFVALKEEWTAEQRADLATSLSILLLMPVQYERGGQVARCLELRLDWRVSDAVKAVLAYRTDADRQGESGDVTTWPRWQDPRAPPLLHGLLTGLATKLVKYTDPGISGLPASIRAAVQFLRARGYPTKKWYRPFGLELLRLGVPLGCLPRGLRRVLGPRLRACLGDGPDISRLNGSIAQ